MEKSIGIIGAGTAGLHLGLYLRQHGVDATIITDKTPDQVRDARLPNSVAHHHVTLARETALGVCHWKPEEVGYGMHRHYFGLPEPLAFPGHFTAPSRAVDYRIYQPTLMEDFTAQGGRIEYRRIERDDIPALADRFDLIAVGAGRGAFTDLLSIHRSTSRSGFSASGSIPGFAPTSRSASRFPFRPAMAN